MYGLPDHDLRESETFLRHNVLVIKLSLTFCIIFCNNIVYKIMQEINNNDNKKFKNTVISMRILTQVLVFHFMA